MRGSGIRSSCSRYMGIFVVSMLITWLAGK